MDYLTLDTYGSHWAAPLRPIKRSNQSKSLVEFMKPFSITQNLALARIELVLCFHHPFQFKTRCPINRNQSEYTNNPQIYCLLSWIQFALHIMNRRWRPYLLLHKYQQLMIGNTAFFCNKTKRLLAYYTKNTMLMRWTSAHMKLSYKK